jgi:twinkle protein
MKEKLLDIINKEQFDLKQKTVVNFDDLRDRVYDEVLQVKKYTGIQWKKFPHLNEILKGHRSGELTILTGATGSGKTTFLSEYSLDLSTQGVRTLWGSFEIQNHRLAKIMMSQFSGLNLYKNVELFDFISNQFSKLPLYFMNFHGEENIDNVLKTMAKSVVMNDVKNIIIDNLQFMMGNQYLFSFDKFGQQDLIIGKLRKFATNFDCHVTIVIHPRKEDGDELLKVSSIFGTAKSTQEADNVIILQEKKNSTNEKSNTLIKYLEIKKNRFDGELGRINLKFNRENFCFKSSLMDRSSKSLPINEIIDFDDDTVSSSFSSSDITNTNNEISLNDDLNMKKL